MVSKMDFTEQQKYENYMMLRRSVQELQSGVNVTDDWEQAHHDYFIKIRKFFTDFNDVLYSNEDPDLRKKCSELEKLACYTERYIEQTGKLDYAVYKLFLERLLYLADYVVDFNQITDLMENLGM